MNASYQLSCQFVILLNIIAVVSIIDSCRLNGAYNLLMLFIFKIHKQLFNI